MYKKNFIHKTAQLYGDIKIGLGSSIWPNAVIRSEMFNVVIGDYSNVQDFVMIHIGSSTGTKIGNYCSIAHHSTIHGCTIGDNCLIGINATIMDGVVIGDNCIVAGGSFITENSIIPDNSVVAGIPGKIKKNKNNFIGNRFNAYMYYYNSLAYNNGEYRSWSSDQFKELAKEKMLEIQKEYEKLYG